MTRKETAILRTKQRRAKEVTWRQALEMRWKGGASGAQVAAAVGVSRRTLYRWESSEAWETAWEIKSDMLWEALQRGMRDWMRGRGDTYRSWERRLAARAARKIKRQIEKMELDI